MKRWAMVAALVLAAGTVGAAESDESTARICAGAAAFAESQMKARHNGVSMQRLMEAADRQGPDGAKARRVMIIDAYESPRYTNPEVVQRSIEDFRDKWYLRCIKARQE